MLLKSLGNNVVLNGLDLTLSGVGTSIVTCSVGRGYAIQGSTLLQIDDSSTLTINVASLADTTTGGARLGVFIDYEYLETVESNPAILRIYHISSDGMTITPSGFNPAKCLTLIGAINFTKSGSTITALSEYTGETLSVFGSTMYRKGYDLTNNINFALLANAAARQRQTTISSWTFDPSINLYYADVDVGYKLDITCYNPSGEIIYPTSINKISALVARIYMPINTLNVTVCY
jgi:hypothetical protein